MLLDNRLTFGEKTIITTIPYKNISSISVIYKRKSCEFICYMFNGYPLRLKFTDMEPVDKKRLRLIYCAIIKTLGDKPITKSESSVLMNDNISIKEDMDE